VPAAGGALDTVVDINGPRSVSRWAGRQERGVPRLINPRQPALHQSDLFVWRDGRAKNLTADYDFDMGSDVIGGQRRARRRREPTI